MDNDFPILAPSILAADYTKLGAQLDQCLDNDIRWIHCDIMDGHFVPNISYGPNIVRQVNDYCNAFLDVHLMIEDPDRYIDAFVEAGADQITVHQEACPHLHRTLQNIREHNVGAGVALNPGTPLAMLEPVMHMVDLVLLMSVNPGFGGQSFINGTYHRIKKLQEFRDTQGGDFLIEVDGGVNLKTIQKTVDAGADVLVAGSAVFKADDIGKRIGELRHNAQLGKGTII